MKVPYKIDVDPPLNSCSGWWLDSADPYVEPTDWHYNNIPKERLRNLCVGDIVRLRVAFRRGGWEKLYFQITSIETYSKSSSKNKGVRKFRGIGVPVYIEFAWDDSECGFPLGVEISFQRRNIIEVPEWKAGTEDVMEAAKKNQRQPPLQAGDIHRYRYVGSKGKKE